MDKKSCQAYIDEKSDVILNVSDKIWGFAELSLQEFQSCALYCDVLRQEGFEVESPVAGIETAFAASYGSGRPVIGILGEYDALSGLSQQGGATVREEVTSGGSGHGCGHNMLGAGAMAAAFAVKKYLSEQPEAAVPSFSLAAPVRRAVRRNPLWPETASGRNWTVR